MVEVPQYTDIFLILTIVCNLLYAISSPLTTAMQATGRIKWFQVIICIVMLTELPIAYLLLSIGYPPYSVLYASLFVTLLGVLIRIVLISRILPIYEIRYYVTHIFSKNILIVFITYCIAYILHKKMEQDSFFYSCSFKFYIRTYFIFSCLFMRSFINRKICGKPKVSDHFRIKAEKK